MSILIMKGFDEQAKHVEFIIQSVKKDLVSLIRSKSTKLGVWGLITL